MSKENPFNTPPEADKAFAYGDDLTASVEKAEEVFQVTQRLSRGREADEVDIAHARSRVDKSRQISEGIQSASDRGDWGHMRGLMNLQADNDFADNCNYHRLEPRS